jgi:hypothetical protein
MNLQKYFDVIDCSEVLIKVACPLLPFLLPNLMLMQSFTFHSLYITF